MSSPLILASVVGLLGCVWILRRYLDTSALSRVPQPPLSLSEWLWGHDKAIYEADVGETYRRWFDSFGSVVKIRGAWMHSPILVVADIGITKHILQTRIYDYHHSKVVRPRIARMLGRSLGWVEGASEHRRMRRLFNLGLSTEMVKSFAPVIYESVQNVKERLSHAILENKGESPLIINIIDWTGKATLEITGRTSFGHSFDGGESPDAHAIIGAWRKMATMGISPAGYKAMVTLRRFPFLNDIPIKANRAHSVVKGTIHDGIAKELFDRERNTSPDKSQKDLLSLLVVARNEGDGTSEEMMDHISMFIMAGYETTSQTLSYTIWELARHPDVQARLRAEIMEYEGRELSYDEIGTLPYLNAVCQETLRLHPALPYMERVATCDDVLPLDKPIVGTDGKLITEIPIRAGQIIVTPIISIQQQAGIWGETATQWRPERWLSEASTLPAPELLASGGIEGLLSFSLGPRLCVGWRLALYQYKVILMEYIRDFEFVDAGLDMGHKVASTMQPYVKGELHKGPTLPVGVRLSSRE